MTKIKFLSFPLQHYTQQWSDDNTTTRGRQGVHSRLVFKKKHTYTSIFKYSPYQLDTNNSVPPTILFFFSQKKVLFLFFFIFFFSFPSDPDNKTRKTFCSCSSNVPCQQHQQHHQEWHHSHHHSVRLTNQKKINKALLLLQHPFLPNSTYSTFFTQKN